MIRDATDGTRLPAGRFSSWLSSMERALGGQAGSVVPCGTCTACCTASQFVHIAPDETDTLAHVPRELRFPAPGLPDGHVVLGYDERGHCPMLRDGRCSIYDNRPQACRTYDCRVFAAADVEPDDDAIARRSRRWHFTETTPEDRLRHDAVRTAAKFLREHRDELADGAAPANATQLAVLAVEIHDLFAGREGTGPATSVSPSPDSVAAVVRRRPQDAR